MRIPLLIAGVIATGAMLASPAIKAQQPAPAITQGTQGVKRNILQKVDVTALRGKTLRYEAMVRKDQAASEAGLWLMLRGPNKEKLFYINSYDDKLPTGSWERRTLEVLVPDTATTMLVGASIYEADGTMWIDDARLTVAS